MWKIGHLPDEIKNKALAIIEKGADRFWLEINAKALKQRQKILDKLALQLKTENEKPRRMEYHLACTRLLQKEKPNIDDFLNSQIACTKHNLSYWLSTDCWFNHKDLGLLSDKLEKNRES